METPIRLVAPQRPLIRLSKFSFQVIPNYIARFSSKIYLSYSQKVVLLGVGVGITLFGLVARYLKRRKRGYRKSALVKNTEPYRSRKNKPVIIASPTYENDAVSGNISPGFHRSGYARSSVSGASGSAAMTHIGESQGLAPEQYGVMGMEALEGAISLWEDALSSYASGTALPSSEAAEFTQLLQKIIEDAYSLQDHCEHLFLHQHSVLFRSSDITSEASDSAAIFVGSSLERRTPLTSLSSVESFVSAQGDVADLHEFEEFEDSHPDLYLNALKYHEEYGISYRDIRTEWVKCGNDIEYVCKVHCLRQVSHHIFSQSYNKEWFAEAGRNVINGILLWADKDPKDALTAYEDLLGFLVDCDWLVMEAELKGRGVPSLTFYDVVLDFIIIDSFEDLDNPPCSVIAVVQNRWLSNGFKESALATAVWSVLKAKRRLLKNQDGFVAHFYDVMEHLSPVLAWGFLGPDYKLRDLCHNFREQVQGLIQDIFSFSVVRYSSLEELSEDVLKRTHDRYSSLMEKISQPQANGML